MSFFENLKEFFSLASQSGYDIAYIYEKSPNSVYSISLVLLVLFLIVWFFIRRELKIKEAIKLVLQIQTSSNFEDYSFKMTKLITELPKRGIKVAQSLDIQKQDIFSHELLLLKPLNIKEKIEKYQLLSSYYSSLSNGSKQYNINDLSSYYEDKAKVLLDEKLESEIKNYYENAQFNEDDVVLVNSIVTYANKKDDPNMILTPLIDQINLYSYGFNLELFKFINTLDKKESLQVYDNCTKKLKELLNSSEDRISSSILKYMLDNNQKDKVLSYLSKLENKIYLQSLYYTFFGKSDDIDLDLAFVANETQIDSNYGEYIDNKITSNWRDINYIKNIIESPRVLENIGHISYRNILERVEKLENEEDKNKAIAEALETARRAETIAKEAKALARQK